MRRRLKLNTNLTQLKRTRTNALRTATIQRASLSRTKPILQNNISNKLYNYYPFFVCFHCNFFTSNRSKSQMTNYRRACSRSAKQIYRNLKLKSNELKRVIVKKDKIRQKHFSISEFTIVFDHFNNVK